MAENYGVTFAQKLLRHGDYDQAVQAASEHLGKEPKNPEPYHDRARAYAALSRYPEALADYRQAIELDREEQILADWELDDGLFSMLVAWGQAAEPTDEKLRIIGHYAELLPAGNHRKEAEEWALRFQGKLKTTFIKPRD